MKPSKFFEYFIQQKGPNGVSRASSGEIQKNLKSFYLDLAYGNIVQPQYMQFLQTDPRVITEAISDSENQLMECTIILQSMDNAVITHHPIIAQSSFTTTYNKYLMKAHTYGVILAGLRNYAMTGDEAHLVAISVKINSGIMRGAKQQLSL